MIIHNKAIRDKIPEIIEKSGHTCNFKTLDDKEFLIQLEKRLSEEVKKYQRSKDVTELVDILEIVYRIAKLQGISKKEFEKIRGEKAEDRGLFNKNLYLMDSSNYK